MDYPGRNLTASDLHLRRTHSILQTSRAAENIKDMLPNNAEEFALILAKTDTSNTPGDILDRVIGPILASYAKQQRAEKAKRKASYSAHQAGVPSSRQLPPPTAGSNVPGPLPRQPLVKCLALLEDRLKIIVEHDAASASGTRFSWHYHNLAQFWDPKIRKSFLDCRTSPKGSQDLCRPTWKSDLAHRTV